MKDLRLPIKSDSVMDLSEITSVFSGIIIGYKSNKPVGQILYYDEAWYFVIDIDWDSYSTILESSIYELVSKLIKDNKCDSFKVIEFGS